MRTSKKDPGISIETVAPAGEQGSPAMDSNGASSSRSSVREHNSNGFSDVHTDDRATEAVSGILDMMSEGHGFLRPKFRPSDKDIYISSSQIRRFWLRPGDLVEGQGRPPKDNERYYGL